MPWASVAISSAACSGRWAAPSDPLDIHTDPSSSTAPIIGRVAGKGLADDLQDRGYLVVDGLDGRAHYVGLPAGAGLADYPKGAIVEVRAASNGSRPADRAIAALAQADGLYRTNEHLAEAKRRARPGDDARGFVEAHVRRLEALRRAGIVERVEAGVWRVPPDYADRRGRSRDGQGLRSLDRLAVSPHARRAGQSNRIDVARPQPGWR